MRPSRAAPSSGAVTPTVGNRASGSARGIAGEAEGGADEDERREAVRRSVVVDHRLQGFNPAYFDATKARDARLFSHSSQYAKAARALRQSREDAAPFVDAAVRAEITADPTVLD